MPSRGSEIYYRLNDLDEIVFVSENWDALASANSSEHLTAIHVVGQPLWGFITDRTTRALYHGILARARSGRSLRFLVRCDSPECRRLLEMKVFGGPEGMAEFRVRTVSEEKRQRQLLLEPHRLRSEQLLKVCGWCKKVDVGGRWTEVEEAVSLLGLFERSLLPGVTHGICDDCYSRVVSTLG